MSVLTSEPYTENCQNAKNVAGQRIAISAIEKQESKTVIDFIVCGVAESGYEMTNKHRQDQAPGRHAEDKEARNDATQKT